MIKRAFKYDKPLGRMVYNYNSFARELQYGVANGVYHCGEEKFNRFLNSDYGLIITGDLDIISDVNVREYMSYGTKFRLKKIFSRVYAIKRLTTNVDLFIQKMIHRFGLPMMVFEEWRYHVLKDLIGAYNKNYEGINVECYKNFIDYINNLRAIPCKTVT